jgi:hypothetical protein
MIIEVNNMLSSEARLAEAVGKLNRQQQVDYFTEIGRMEKESGAKPPVESLISIAESIPSKAPRVIKRNNPSGRYLTETELRDQAGFTNLNEMQQRQYNSCRKAGFSEALSLSMASPEFSTKLKEAIKRGQNAEQFAESFLNG